MADSNQHRNLGGSGNAGQATDPDLIGRPSNQHIERTPREILETGAAWVTESELKRLVETVEAAEWAITSHAERARHLEEQLEAAQANERHLTNLLDWRTKERDEWKERAVLTAAEVSASNPASQLIATDSSDTKDAPSVSSPARSPDDQAWVDAAAAAWTDSTPASTHADCHKEYDRVINQWRDRALRAEGQLENYDSMWESGDARAAGAEPDPAKEPDA